MTHPEELVIEVFCTNTDCTLGEVLETGPEGQERFQGWWNHVGVPDRSKDSDTRDLQLELSDNILGHLSICPGPIAARDISKEEGK